MLTESRRSIWLFGIILETLLRGLEFGRWEIVIIRTLDEWINVFIWIKPPFFLLYYPVSPMFFILLLSLLLNIRPTWRSPQVFLVNWPQGRGTQLLSGFSSCCSGWMRLSALSRGAWSQGEALGGSHSATHSHKGSMGAEAASRVVIMLTAPMEPEPVTPWKQELLKDHLKSSCYQFEDVWRLYLAPPNRFYFMLA